MALESLSLQVFLGSPHYLQGSPLVSDYCIYGSPRVSSLFTGVSMGLQQWYIWVSWGFPIIYRGLRGSPIIVYMGPLFTGVSVGCTYGSPRVSPLLTGVSVGLQLLYVWVSKGLPIIHKGLHCSCSSSSSSSSMNKETTEKTLNRKKSKRETTNNTQPRKGHT